MKKYLSLLIVFISVLLLSGCSKLKESLCAHEYVVKSTVLSTCSKEGKITKECQKCKKELIETLALLEHDIVTSTIGATCIVKGQTVKECKNCDYRVVEEAGNYTPHDYSDWKVEIEKTEDSHGVKTRSCINCGHIEYSIISNKGYLNTESLLKNIDESETYDIYSYEELLIYFDACIIQRCEKFKCNLMYEHGTIENILDSLLNDSNVKFAYHVKSSLQNNYLTLMIEHSSDPTLVTPNIIYTQYESLNTNNFISSRSDTYNEFKINRSAIKFNVSTTDQLYFSLENGICPIPVSESIAYEVYEKMKSVLRRVVDDSMTDVVKVRAIYEYLINYVVYDEELLQLLYQNAPGLTEYRGYYLEGVFLDKKAVCEGISKAMAALCNIEGIPCVVVEGYQTENPNAAMHAWNKVYVDGSWYIVDATSGGTIINSEFEVLSYKYFLVDEESYSKKYTGTGYSEIKCEKRYDVYSILTYQDIEGVKDLKINSYKELVDVVNYFNSFINPNLTIEFEINFDVGESSLDEIQKAYTECGVYGSITYIEDGNVFMLIK